MDISLVRLPNGTLRASITLIDSLGQGINSGRSVVFSVRDASGAIGTGSYWSPIAKTFSSSIEVQITAAPAGGGCWQVDLIDYHLTNPALNSAYMVKVIVTGASAGENWNFSELLAITNPLPSQFITDALKSAPSSGAPSTGSVYDLLDFATTPVPANMVQVSGSSTIDGRSLELWFEALLSIALGRFKIGVNGTSPQEDAITFYAQDNSTPLFVMFKNDTGQERVRLSP